MECIERKSQTVVDNSKCIDEDEPADVACEKDPCVPGTYVLEKYEIMYSLITIMFHLKTFPEIRQISTDILTYLSS